MVTARRPWNPPIGQTKAHLEVKKLSKLRLHTRTIIRDGRQAFIGSQSLRATELDLRREVGLIVRDARIVNELVESFESDWDSGGKKESASDTDEQKIPKKDADKVVKILIEELHPIAATVKKAVRKAVAKAGDGVLEDGSVQDTVTGVVKKAVKQAVREAAKD